LFRMVKLAENAGFGLDKIENNWRQYNQTTPEIIRDFDSTLMKLIVKGADLQKTTQMSGEMSGEMSGKMSGKILDLIRTDNQATIPELSNALQVTTRTIERNLRKLKQQGLIQRVGPAKGGYWKIKSV